MDCNIPDKWGWQSHTFALESQMKAAKTYKTDRSAEMEAFIEVVCAGSFSAAARALDMTPSAVSRIVSRIEKRLDVRLIIRTTRQLRLTSEGEAYALVCRRILKDLNEAEASIAERARPKGLIRVSAATAHNRLAIVPLVKEFLQRYPAIVVEMDVSDQIRDVIGGYVDIAIRFGPLPDSALTARYLGETGRTVVASPEYLARAGTPEVPSDLHRHNCLDFSFRRIEPGWPFIAGGENIMLPVSGNMTANNGETLVELAKQGIGITRVGNFHIEDALTSGELVPLLEGFNPLDKEAIHAVFIGGKNMPARVRVFVDYLVEKMTPHIV
ncbi:HTH-type transcriptional regulator PgrR [Thalassocella blandensis]|nr:HTH-type transcriptional regulator PgrR [Thalassocella blandensis]